MLTFRSEDFRGSQLKLPLKVTSPATLRWDFATDGSVTNFTVTYSPAPTEGVEFVCGLKVDGKTPIVVAQPSDSADKEQQSLVVVGPLQTNKNAGMVELEGEGELIVSWTQPADPSRSWFFRGEDASLKYHVTMESTSELRADEERQQRITAEREALRTAKIAELQSKAAEAAELVRSLSSETGALAKETEQWQGELECREATYEKQKLRVAAEQARLSELLPPVKEAQRELSELAARQEHASASMSNADAWQRLHIEECELYRSGKWVFMGWKGGGRP